MSFKGGRQDYKANPRNFNMIVEYLFLIILCVRQIKERNRHIEKIMTAKPMIDTSEPKRHSMSQ